MHFIPQSKVLRIRHASVGKALPPDLSRIVAFESRQESIISEAFTTFVEECRSDAVVNKFREAYANTRMVHALAVTDEAVEDFSHVLETVFNNAGKFESNWLYKELDINQVKKIDVSPEVNLSFDPGSAEAARLMRSSLLQFIREITQSQRNAIRTVLAQALQQGLGPAQAARLFRDKIGLTAYQMGAVDKYRSLLQSGSSEALSRTLRDRRFDTAIGRAIDQGVQLSASQIERMVGRYQERMLIMRSETIARTEMLSTVNAARHESMRQMATKVDLEMGRIQRTWRTTMDGRQRDTHAFMNKQVRGAEEHFVSPSGAKLMYPGDRTAPAAEVINCRCVLQTKILPPSESTAIRTPAPKVPRKPRTPAITQPPGVYDTLSTRHRDYFADGFVTFAENDTARAAFTQLNTQVVDVLRKVEATQIAEADKILEAALKSAEALELAEAKAAKKYAEVVREAARARGIASTTQAKEISWKTRLGFGKEEVVQAQKFEYGVPKKPKKPPVGTGKAPDAFIRSETYPDLAEMSTAMYRESLKRPLTESEVLTVQRYTGSQYEIINKEVDKRLRDPDLLPSHDARAVRADGYIKDMDAIMKKTRITEDIMVFRGMGADRWHRTFDGLQIGQTVIIDKAVLSTSMSRTFAANWYHGARPFVVEIMVPKGSRALSIEPISSTKWEYEVLLDRSSKFVVHSISSNKAVLELIP